MSYGDRTMTEDQDLLFRVRISWGEYFTEHSVYDWTQSPKKLVEVKQIKHEAGSRLYGPYTSVTIARRKRTTISKEYTHVSNKYGGIVAEIEACQPKWKVVE